MADIGGISSSKLAELGLQSTDNSKKKEGLAQEDFLDLLVAQMRNQNPMEPQTNGDFLAQMAQFGTVDGIKKMEDILKDLSGSLQSNQALQASTLVGRSVTIPTDKGALTDQSALSGRVDLPHTVGNLNISIYTPQGELMQSMNLGLQPSGPVNFSWDGTKNDGNKASAGIYEVRAEGLINGETKSFATQMQGNVNSVTLGKNGGGITLSVEGMGNIAIEDVLQIN